MKRYLKAGSVKVTTPYGSWSWIEETIKTLSLLVFKEKLWDISTDTADIKGETNASKYMPASSTTYMKWTEYLKGTNYQTGVRQEWNKNSYMYVFI